jgi:glycosyltransferase involved in cell wall biosynthesis
MQIVSNTGVNGAINHCLLLSGELARRGHQVALVCHPESWIAQRAACEPIEIVASDLHRWPTDELRRIAQEVQRRGIDVVHTHMSRANFFGVLLRWFCGVPSVATAHSCHFQPHWMFNDFVIACSEATRRYHQTYNLVRPDRIRTIRTFIDYRRMVGVSRDARARIRASLGVDDSCHLIGSIGNVIPRKGARYLVAALPKILAAVPDTRLVLAGKLGPADYVRGIRTTAERLAVAPKVIMTGHRDDVDLLMAALDVCVLPSLDEPLGMAVLEAMAAGLPVVASDVGGLPECLGHGETGTLVPPADAGALADAIIPLLRNPRRRRKLGENGRKRVREHFSAESQTPRIEAVFRHVIRRRRAA